MLFIELQSYKNMDKDHL